MARLRLLPVWIVLLLSFPPLPLPVTAHAADPSPAAASPVPPPAVDNGPTVLDSVPSVAEKVDRSHDYVGREFERSVTWFDDLFGDSDYEGPVTKGNILLWGNEVRWENGAGVKYHPFLRGRIHLPKLSRKIKVAISEENREEAASPNPSEPGTPTAYAYREAVTLRAVNTELRYYLLDSKEGYAFLAAGTRLTWPPETFVRGRILRRFLLRDNSFLSPSATPFWQDRIGFGATPQLEFGVPFLGDHLFLWTNSATFYANRAGIPWGSEVSFIRALAPTTVVALDLGARGSTKPEPFPDQYAMITNRYRVRVRYRRPILRPWLFVELAPEAGWKKDGDGPRLFVPAFTFRLDLSTEGYRPSPPQPAHGAVPPAVAPGEAAPR
jgi:hypothetical protein